MHLTITGLAERHSDIILGTQPSVGDVTATRSRPMSYSPSSVFITSSHW